MKSKNVLGLVVAAVFFLVTAYLLSRSSAETAAVDAGPGAVAPGKAPVVFPRDVAPRRPEGALATDRAAPAPKPPNLDAMQRALLGGGAKGAIFVEANAIRHAPLMEKILRCREKDAADGLTRMKNELGIDPMEDIDRIGFDGDVFVASGFFEDLKLPADIGEGTPYGDAARLWTETTAEGESMVFGKLGNGMLLTGVDDAAVKAAIDRAEGRQAAEVAGLPPGFGQGEIYGTVGAEFIQSLLGGSEDPLAENLARLVTSTTVRMSVGEDAALSLDLQAKDERSGEDLASAVKGGLAVLRAEAENAGDRELVSLLDQARVEPRGDGRFDVDAVVPGDVLLRGMGCDASGTPLARPAPEATAPPPASP